MSETPTLSRKEARRKRRQRVSITGILGELLITAGVLVFLFLGWQLWFNDLVVGGQQNNEAAGIARSWDVGGDPAREKPTVTDYGDPVVAEAPANAKTFAVMIVPRFGADWARDIAEGVGIDDVLNKKRIGHYPTTQMPGAVGNFAVAAHRLTYGAPFRDIDQLQVGDKLYVATQDGYYTYIFRNLEYVDKHGVGVLDPVPQLPAVDPTKRLLTIMSCNPKYSVAERIIAYAVFDSWQPNSAGPPAEIAPLISAKG